MDELVKDNNEIVALIPARGGSKRIKNKNLRVIKGKPLIAHAIEHASLSSKIDKIYVSTDSEIIAEIGRIYGAEVPFIRPKKLAEDSSTDYDVFEHFLDWYKKNRGAYPKLIVQIRPTSPLRIPKMLDEAINTIENNLEADSLRSVSKPHQTPYKMWKIENNYLKPIVKYSNEDFFDMPTQSLPIAYSQDGFVDIIKPKTIIRQKSMAGNKILAFNQHKMAIDIDNVKDLNLAEIMIKDNSITRGIMNKGKMGIIQGRLTKSCNKLQNFPDDWLNEFHNARRCGYSYIELFRDNQYNSNNPLWNNEEINLNKIIEQQYNSGVVVRSICDDYVLECDFLKLEIIQLQRLIDLLIIAHKLGASQVIYPLMGKADVKDRSRRKKATEIIKMLAGIADVFNITINIETNLEDEILTEFLRDIGKQNVKICLDTGNLIYNNIDPIKQILNLNTNIGHIHIKDKDKKGNNVMLTTGELNLNGVIQALIKINYNKNITFETTRGENCLETARNNIDLFNKLLKKDKD